MANKDTLYTNRLKNAIFEFMKLTQSEFSIVSTISCVNELLTSSILNVLAKDPSNSEARACLIDFKEKNPDIPSGFISTWISFCSLTASLHRNILGSINQINLKLNIDNIEPLKKLTSMSVNAKIEKLKKDLKLNEQRYEARDIAPLESKIILNEDTLDAIVSSTALYHSIIMEGMRRNAIEPDNYIRTRANPN